MNDYIKAAVNRWKGKESLINPLSEMDGKIISAIQEIFLELKVEGMVNALRQYKFLKDEEIYNLVLRFKNSSAINRAKKEATAIVQPENPNKAIKQRNFLEFNDCLFDIEFIVKCERTEQVNYTGTIVYKIVINPTVEEKMMYSNTYFTYKNEKERDLNWELLKRKLTEFNINFR